MLSSKSCPSPHPNRPAVQYGLMIDAGSTGSRIHIYRFNYCHGTSPILEDEIFEQIKPGLSSPTFKTPEEAADSLDPLLQTALKFIPEDSWRCTPVGVKATAGLRMLNNGKGDEILSTIRTKLERQYPFALSPDSVEIMAGKDEGWIDRLMFPSSVLTLRISWKRCLCLDNCELSFATNRSKGPLAHCRYNGSWGRFYTDRLWYDSVTRNSASFSLTHTITT